MRSKFWLVVVVLFLMLACNLPFGNTPATDGPATVAPSGANVDVVGTSVELTTAAKMTELAATSAVVPASATFTFTPSFTPTLCTPQVTATTAANIRSGPDTVYDIISFLPLNGSTTIAGRNDANTWWYILLPGSTNNYGWIAGSVVKTTCLPQSVQVVAAPPTPIPPSPTNTQPAEAVLAPPVAGTPDLVASGMQYWPNPAKNNQPISIQVKLTNSGSAPAGSFSVSWLSNQDAPGCNWDVQGLGVGASKNLDCEFTYNGNATANYWITLVVDTGNQVAESNEGNNKRDGKLQVKP
jgi:hypothetical protein